MDAYFSNHNIDPDTEYFLYIGEIKNYGLNLFLKESLARIWKRPVDFIAVVPDILEQYEYDNILVINPVAKEKFFSVRQKYSCRVPGSVFMRAVSESAQVIRLVKQLCERQARVYIYMSRDAFRRLSDAAIALLNQAVLLKGINDSKVKMWQRCESIHASYVRPYYVFNCSYRNPQFSHLRVPVEKGRDSYVPNFNLKNLID